MMTTRQRVTRQLLVFAILVVAIPLSGVALPGQNTASAAALKNEDVVKMVEAGLGDSTIVLAIQHSPTDFDTSPKALIELKNQGVSQKVLDAMVASHGGPTTPAMMIIGKWKASTLLDYPSRHEEISEMEFRTDGSFSSVSIEGLAKGASTDGTYKISNGNVIEIKDNNCTQTAQMIFQGPDNMVWHFSDGRVSHFKRNYETSSTIKKESATPCRLEVTEPEYVGIFFYLDPNGQLKPLERQTPVMKTKARFFGYGGAKSLYELPGARSPVRFTVGQRLEFVVRGFTAQMDPQSMVELIVMQSKKKKREVVVAKVGAFSTSMTYDAKAGTMSILATKYGQSSVKVTPASPLPPGEYALRSGSLDLFCFGVDPDSRSEGPQPK